MPPGLPAPDTSTQESERIGADLLYEAGRWAQAGRRYTEVFARHPDDIESLTGLGLSAARLGDLHEATRAEEQLAGWALPFAMGRTSYGRARISALLGDSASAVALLQRAFREGYPVVSIWERHVHSDREFAGWAQYAPFRELMGVP